MNEWTHRDKKEIAKNKKWFKEFFSKGQDNDLFNLTWNKQSVVIGQPYAVCKGKENELVALGTHSRHLFLITKQEKNYKSK